MEQIMEQLGTNKLMMETKRGQEQENPNKDIERETRARNAHGEQPKTGHKSDTYRL